MSPTSTSRKYLVAFAILFLAATSLGQETPQSTVVFPTPPKPNFVIIDRMVLNLNAVTAIFCQQSPKGSAQLTVDFINGQTKYYQVKLSEEEWTKVQTQIISVGNR